MARPPLWRRQQRRHAWSSSCKSTMPLPSGSELSANPSLAQAARLTSCCRRLPPPRPLTPPPSLSSPQRASRSFPHLPRGLRAPQEQPWSSSCISQLLTASSAQSKSTPPPRSSPASPPPSPIRCHYAAASRSLRRTTCSSSAWRRLMPPSFLMTRGLSPPPGRQHILRSLALLLSPRPRVLRASRCSKSFRCRVSRPARSPCPRQRSTLTWMRCRRSCAFGGLSPSVLLSSEVGRPTRPPSRSLASGDRASRHRR
mmetsp:Transcript_42393/g.85004  ORF Transcript_42393/g.85004 Transcript_42393/m.85004 type:complete len:256 (+) Transcript_42393:1279-2046(+)